MVPIQDLNQAAFEKVLARLRRPQLQYRPRWIARPDAKGTAFPGRYIEHYAGAYYSARGIVERMASPPQITFRRGDPVYMPDADHIILPPSKSFPSLSAYYATLFHLLVHATGNKTRLDRCGMGHDRAASGSEGFHREDIVAELGAVFLCGRVGLLSLTLDDSCALLDTRLRLLRKQRGPLFEAAPLAEKAADCILGTNGQQQVA